MVRFMRKVQVNEETGCWDWIGGTSRGYAMFGLAAQKTVRAARWIYEQVIGPIPDGLTIDHECDRPICVNPEHLRPKTLQANIMRSSGLGPRNAAKTHCPAGHPYDEENTYFYFRNGGQHRICRECSRERCRRRYHARQVDEGGCADGRHH